MRVATARKANKFDYDAPIEGLKALDRYTWQIKLNEPFYIWIYDLADCRVSLRGGARGGGDATATTSARIPWERARIGWPSGSAPRRWCSSATRISARSTSTASRQPAMTRAKQMLAMHERQAPADGRSHRGERSSRSRSRAGSRSRTRRWTSCSRSPRSSPTSPCPTTSSRRTSLGAESRWHRCPRSTSPTRTST